MRSGGFIISLDFELYWGIGDHIDYQNYREYFDNTLSTIPKILQVFRSYNINCTWATVGMLWNKNWILWEENKPLLLPEYKNLKLSNYNLSKKINKKVVHERHFFALDLIEKIKNTPGQELATHTYGHYYSNEAIVNNKVLAADLERAHKMAQQTNIKLRSIVLPRNQFVEATLETLREQNILTVRSNPNVWYWKLSRQHKFSSKIARLIDSYTSFFTIKSYPWKQLEFKGGLLLQPASRFLRPVTKKIILLDRLKINRIKKEMSYAAKNGELYHLWWHPHNFAVHPISALKELEEILEHFKYLEKRFGFRSYNMAGLLEEVKNETQHE